MWKVYAWASITNWWRNWAGGRQFRRPMQAAAKSLDDLEETTRLGNGRVDLTIGSALDIFGGHGERYADVVAFNRTQGKT